MSFGKEPCLPCPKIERGQERLTPEQEVYARQFALERSVAMFSTAAIDEAVAEEHLRHACRMAELEPPQMRWFDSPLAFAKEYTLALPTVGDRYGSPERQGNMWRDSTWSRALSQARDRVRKSVEDDVWKSVEMSMESQMCNGDHLEYRVFDSLLEEGVGGYYGWFTMSAYLDMQWLSCARFFHEMREENTLMHLARFNEMVSGYLFVHQEIWLVRKPVRLERDEQGRLHSEDGMCLQYRDGWGLYAQHGRSDAGSYEW